MIDRLDGTCQMSQANVRRSRTSHKSGTIGMTQSFDLILKGGTVVNHDGEGVRDLAITGGRIAAIGDLSQASAGRGDRLPRPACAARA